MQLDKRGFFLPTIMIFISLFTIILVFIIYENLAYTYLINSYEKEIYYEQALLDTKQYIVDYINYDKSFIKTCNQHGYEKKDPNFEIQVVPYCILDDLTSVLLNNLDLKLKGQEEFKITKEQYVKTIKILDFISKKEVMIFNELAKIEEKIDEVIKESKKLKSIKKGMIKKIDKYTYPYTVFNITINIGEAKYNYIYVYNYDNINKNTIFYI